MSRSYYAAYAAVASALGKRGESFPKDRQGPSHQKLPKLTLNNLGLPLEKAKAAKRRVTYLYRWRIQSDYQPGFSLQKRDAVTALKEATILMKELEVIKSNAE